jgi:hypothetical protein
MEGRPGNAGVVFPVPLPMTHRTTRPIARLNDAARAGIVPSWI